MNIKRQFPFVLFLLAFVSSNIAQQKGKLEAHSDAPIYTNSGLGFELTLPRNWYVANAKDLEVLADEARKELKEGYKLSSAAILNQTRIENISFGISKKRLGTQRNSALSCGTVKQPSAEVTLMIAANATKEFSLKEPNNRLAKDVSIRKIGGRDFAEFDLIVDSLLGKQNLRVLMINFKGYSLTFALTYWDDLDDLKLMMAAVESIRFF